MIIALFGSPGAGKDTVGEYLVEQHGFKRIAFADKVRELAYEILAANEQLDVDFNGWDIAKRHNKFYRELLERVGEGARKVFGQDIWIRQALDVADLSENIVITDLRKEPEKEYLDCLPCDVVYVMLDRDGLEKRPGDQWQRHWADHVVKNNGTIEELQAQIAELLREI